MVSERSKVLAGRLRALGIGLCLAVPYLGWTAARGFSAEESPWVPALVPPGTPKTPGSGAGMEATGPVGWSLEKEESPSTGPGDGDREQPEAVPGGSAGAAAEEGVTPSEDSRVRSLRAAWLDFARGEAPYAARTLLEESLAVVLEPLPGGPEQHLDALREGSAFVLRGRAYRPDSASHGEYRELRSALEQFDSLDGSLVERILEHGRSAFRTLGAAVPGSESSPGSPTPTR